MKQLLYSEWLVLTALKNQTMTLEELFAATKLDKGLLVEVISNLIKMKKVSAARGIFRASAELKSDNRFNHFNNSFVKVLNETYQASLKDSIPTSA